MALKKCIKARIPTRDGWKDVRLERDEDYDNYISATDYDEEILFSSGIDEIIACLDFTNAIECSNCNVYEVTWQSDKWPE